MTDLARGLDESSLKGLVSSTEVWKSTDQGAATIAVAGFDPEVDGMTFYLHTPFLNIRVISDSNLTRDYWGVLGRLPDEAILKVGV